MAEYKVQTNFRAVDMIGNNTPAPKKAESVAKKPVAKAPVAPKKEAPKPVAVEEVAVVEEVVATPEPVVEASEEAVVE